MHSSDMPAALYVMAGLLRAASVSRWSGPSSLSRAAAIFWKAAIASGNFLASRKAIAWFHGLSGSELVRCVVESELELTMEVAFSTEICGGSVTMAFALGAAG